MKYIKIIPDENADLETLNAVLSQLKGIKSTEIIDESNPESELKKSLHQK